MADKPADGEARPEELSAPSERHAQERHGPAGDEHDPPSVEDDDQEARWAGDEHDPPPVEDDDRRIRWAGDEHDPPSGDGDQQASQTGDERDRWSGEHDGEQRAEGSERVEVAWPGPSLKPRLRRFRRFRLSAWIALVLAAVVVVVSVLWESGPPTEAELWEQAGLSNGRIKNPNGTNNKILIGVKDDIPSIAYRRPDCVFEGFDIEIARMIAADLGYLPEETEFLVIDTEDRARMQGKDMRCVQGKAKEKKCDEDEGKPEKPVQDGTAMQGFNECGQMVKADLVVASFSITADREANPAVGFSKPYLSTEQSVVTLKHMKPDSDDDLPAEITDLSDLKNSKICTLGASTSKGALSEAIKTPDGRSKAVITGKNLLKDCVDGLKRGDFDAVSTDAALLAGFVMESNARGAKESEKLRHHDVGEELPEHWAVNAGANAALRTLVDLSLYRSYADPRDRRWEDAYEKFIVPLMSEGSGNVDTNMIMAAAEQPCLLPPPVRRWPWERALSIQEC
jgi:glutamate transport system substrate-binding protein